MSGKKSQESEPKLQPVEGSKHTYAYVNLKRNPQVEKDIVEAIEADAARFKSDSKTEKKSK